MVAVDSDTRKAVHFTNYTRPGVVSLYDNITIWQAACATSAATSYFKPVQIIVGKIPRTFIDGALQVNNPVFHLWVEAEEQFRSDIQLEQQICCVLSIGTGKPQLESFGDNLKDVGKSFIAMVTETQDTHETFHGTHRDLARRKGYFRLNPLDISLFKMDDPKKLGPVQARTEAYVNDPGIKDYIEDFQQVTGQEQSASIQAQLLVEDFS